MGAYVFRFRTVVRANKISVADINLAGFTAHGIGHPHYVVIRYVYSRNFTLERKYKPLRGNMDWDSWQDKIYRCLIIEHLTQPLDPIVGDDVNASMVNKDRILVNYSDRVTGKMLCDPLDGNLAKASTTKDPETSGTVGTSPLMLVIVHGIW
jgi:hypothetical protein